MSALDFELIDIPIEFKTIRPEDFGSDLYESTFTTIKPNKKGFISDELLPILNKEFDLGNTLVINAGVGQGKSTAIIDKIVDYTKSVDYIVIIAVPYNSLIEQYEKDCLKRNISANEIFNIQEIKKYNFLNKQGLNDSLDNADSSKISDFKVHIITINALLGNPGDDAILPASERTKYFNELTFFCNQNNKKLVVVFDEIHDGIQNFRGEYIYKLWGFQGIIFKIFIISATFNEASKEVIKYLSEFTERKISIVESERIRNLNKQSKLNLIFNDYKALSNNSYLKKLTKDLIAEKKAFDIILYSKKQTKQLLKPNGLLYSVRNELNLCYRDVFDSSKKTGKKYNGDFINIGTNFTTGVNILKEDHSLIIVLPKRLQSVYINNKGVFSSGISALIQTLARQRIVGEIYIVMPTPYKIKEETLPYSQKVINDITEIFSRYANEVEVKYSNINRQSELLSKAYNTLENLNITATYNIDNVDRTGMNILKYPKKEEFILEKGEKLLTRKFFDGDLATYTFFGAITNQFLNCTLHEIFCDNKIIIEDGDLLGAAYEVYRDFAFKTLFENPEDELDEALHTYYSEYEIIKNILLYLVNKEIYLNEERADVSSIRHLKRALTYLTITHGSGDSYKGLQNISSLELGKILSKKYFQSCVKFSDIELFKKENQYYTKTLFDTNYRLPDKTFIEVIHFKKWEEYISVIEKEIMNHDGVFILSTSPSNAFRLKFKKEKMLEDLENMISYNLLVNEEIVSFKDTFSKAEKANKVETFYNLLVSTFFKKNTAYKQITIAGTRIRFYKNVERINLKTLNINLLYSTIPEATL